MTDNTGGKSKPAAAATGSKPLYAQAKAVLQERIRTGEWRPGAVLPNEFEIARELGISQGTARKALESLAREQLLVRRQGLGTFVNEHTPANLQFRFFHIYDANGGKVLPDSRAVKIEVGPALAQEEAHLDLAADALVMRLSRERTRDDRPFILETIVLPADVAPGLDRLKPVPNTLYDLFQGSFGVTVTHAEERLTAVAASTEEAGRLGIDTGAALLRIERVAFAIDDRRIEWRVSLCHLAGAYYHARVG